MSLDATGVFIGTQSKLYCGVSALLHNEADVIQLLLDNYPHVNLALFSDHL